MTELGPEVNHAAIEAQKRVLKLITDTLTCKYLRHALIQLYFRAKSFVYCTRATRLFFLRCFNDDTSVLEIKDNPASAQSYQPCLVRFFIVWLSTAHDALITLWTVRKCPKDNTSESRPKQKLQMALTTSIVDLKSTRETCCVIPWVLQNRKLPSINRTNVKENSPVSSQTIRLCKKYPK